MIAFRCDGDQRVGAGHVARSLQIARAFAAAGEDVVFVGVYAGIAAGLLAAAGMPAQAPDLGQPLGVAPGVDLIVVDSYELEDADLARARTTAPVAAIVDEAAATEVDVVLAYHLDAAERVAVAWAGTTAILGGAYAPVRPETVAGRRSRGFARALVATGGSDTGLDLAVRAANRLLMLARDLEVFVAAPGRAPVADARLTWETVPGGLTERIAWADVAVSAAGSTPYELACAGVPAALEPVAPNQVPVSGAFVAHGLATTDPVLLADEPTRAALAAAGPRAIDGYGAFRARDALLAALAGRPLPRVLRYRPAEAADAERLLAWRNDPEVRAVSRTSDVIAPATHASWLAGVLDDAQRTLLIAEDGDEPVGSVRFDRDGEEAEISVALAPGARDRGLGSQVLREASELQLAAYPGLSRILAEVHHRNLRSLRAFARAGYAPVTDREATGRVLVARIRAQETPNPAQEQR